MKIKLRYKGGKGSGFEGHAGRPGKVGGSSSGGSWKASNKISNKLPKDYKGSVKITTHYSGMNNFVTSNSDSIILHSRDLDEFFKNSLARDPDAYRSVEPYTEQDKAKDEAIQEARAKKRAKFNSIVIDKKW